VRYFGNGGGRDSYIIKDWGGVLNSNDKKGVLAEGYSPNLKLDRMFGRLPDMEMAKMLRALKGD
jgi:hypothetical protein